MPSMGRYPPQIPGLQLRSFTQLRKSSMERKNVYTEYVSGCDVADELLTLVPHGGNLSSM